MSLIRRLQVNWKYALGEIAIIVTGILLAISLDNCNQSRSERRLEEKYLGRLAADLHRDTARFNFTERGVGQKLAALAYADSALNAAVLQDTLALLQALVAGSNFAWSQTRMRTTTFQDLQSTGNFHLIRDPQLRAHIVNLYAEVDGEYRRLDPRRTRYGPLSYELLPRNGEYVLDSAQVRPQLKAVMDGVRNSDIERAIAAERNFGEFALAINTGLRQRVLRLLAVLPSTDGQEP